MSKTKLRKELANLTREQLIEVITDAYEARKEVKEYFDFYLNPDVDKLMGNFAEDIKKEFRRTKWGMSKARVSHMKSRLKIITGYKLDAKVNLDAMFIILTLSVVNERFYNIPEALSKYIGTLTNDILSYSDKTLTSDYALTRLGKIIDSGEILKSRAAELKRVVAEFKSELR